MNKSKWADILTKKFLEKEYVENEKSTIQIAEEIGCVHSTVNKKLKQFNITTRRGTGGVKRHVVNDFSVLTPESCYWAGFIFGDGCIPKGKDQLCVELSIIDIDHLKRLSYFICGINHVNTYTNRKSHKVSCLFSITSTKLVNNLKNFGIIPRKTYDSSLILPPKYQADFIRGYFDADGCFTKSTSFHNEKPYTYHRMCWVSYLKDNLETIGEYLPTVVKTRRSNNLYRLTIGGKSELIDTINLLLPNYGKGVYLERKWDKIYDSIDKIKTYVTKQHWDYTGSVFGSLTVLDTYTENHNTFAQCRCVCGKDVTVRFDQIKCGETKSCGCLKGFYNKQTRDKKRILELPQYR